MTELIDKKHIVNVSLEGTNSKAFEFTDPPFTLLTSDVLPGIPLARIKPLEQIMVEALQSSAGKKKMKIEAKIKEDGLNDAPPPTSTTRPDQHMQCPDGMMYSAAKGGCVPMPEQDEPVSTMGKVEADLATTKLGTSAASDGSIMQSGNPMGDKMRGYEAKEEMPATGKWDASFKGNDTSQPRPEDIRSGPSRSKAPDRGLPETGGLPHTTDLTKVIAGVTPFEYLPTQEALIAQVNALGAKSGADTTAAIWKEKCLLTHEKYTQLLGAYKQQELAVKQANEQKENAIKEMYNSEMERDKHKRFYEEEAGERRKTERLLIEVKNRLDDVNSKYNDALGVNLELSKKLTSANEDYLELAKQKENVEEKLTQAHTNAKKTLKLRL
jgi:hypothetical protein